MCIYRELITVTITTIILTIIMGSVVEDGMMTDIMMTLVRDMTSTMNTLEVYLLFCFSVIFCCSRWMTFAVHAMLYCTVYGVHCALLVSE